MTIQTVSFSIACHCEHREAIFKYKQNLMFSKETRTGIISLISLIFIPEQV
jgi:hypothetical protein